MAFRKSSLFLLILHIISLALAEPVQYCRFGHRSNAVDFCMGVTMHHNHTSGAHDMYMSFAVTRSSHLGWTAICTGPSMKGALMFIMYGDPGSGVDPILSIRTVDGHNQPREITPHDMGGSDIRVLQSMWMPAESRDSPTSHTHSDGTAMYEARMAVVCYACTRWPGSPILASSSSQAWIWAWNDQQELPVYSFDANLQMHKHHAGNGGWGVFYMDLVRSVSDAVRRPSLPPLRLGISTLGTSDTPIGASGLLASLKANALVNAHGFFMGAAFMLLFPVGVVAIRSGSTKAFKYHWVIQVVAMCFVVVGVVTGLKISGNKITVPHQWIDLLPQDI
ncbi:integral component of membrane [Ascochyta rabiei]|uniref:Integral component of membrane n=1 Tax=Didymella rabiei TaxID=5454 RepID=A0A163IT82_DIDRA|nr:integral component of membrane [Ascochyta rabiei]